MVTTSKPKRMSPRERELRLQALDALRLQRPLTASEQAEANRLSYNQYMHVWRSRQRELLGLPYEKNRLFRQSQREIAA
jgi:hypothetical protein